MIKKLVLLSQIALIPLLLSCSQNIPLSTNNINNISSSEIKTEDNTGIIVRFNKDVTKEQIEQINKQSGIGSYEVISKDLNIVSLKSDTKNIDEIKKKYENSNLVKYVNQDAKLNIFPYTAYNADKTEKAGFNVKNDGYIPDDEFYSNQWNAQSINADKAWTITTGSKDITVAVIDSGVDPDHPDLKANLLPLIDVWAETGKRDILASNTFAIDYSGIDGNGHGTHVAGIIGAVINNNEGVAGISGNVKILPIKASNCKGDTYASVITRAISVAIEKGVKVINISIGGPQEDGTDALRDAVELAISKGIVFVSATGNESDRAKNVITDVTIPAAYPGVLSVGSLTEFDTVANYSNGGDEISIAAPGGAGAKSEGRKIYSTWPTYKTYLGYTENIIGPYAYISGTSMSSPHVAGVAALVLSKEPNLSAQKVRVRILSTAINLNKKGFDTAAGYGKIDAYDALTKNSDDK